VTVADLNGDGSPDIVTANWDSRNASVLLNTGAGYFQTPVSYPVEDAAHGVTVGDFNQDGIPDLAVAGDGGVSVLLGNGDGTFGPFTHYDDFAGFVVAAAVADFNGDAATDLVLADWYHDTATVLLNDSGWAPVARPNVVMLSPAPSAAGMDEATSLALDTAACSRPPGFQVQAPGWTRMGMDLASTANPPRQNSSVAGSFAGSVFVRHRLGDWLEMANPLAEPLAIIIRAS
jgi:hypothetical protein